MTLTTTFAITVPTNPELVFLAARRTLEIPGEHPFEVSVSPWGDTMIFSEPANFGAMLIVWHNHGEPAIRDEGDPPLFVRVSLDTHYSYLSPRGEDACVLHRRITTELGDWCDRQGLPWTTRDEEHGTWREHTPAF